MAIDFRLRPPIGAFLDARMYDVERTARLNRSLGFEPAPSMLERSLEATLGEMDEAGVELGVVVGRTGSSLGEIPNAELVDLVGRHPDRFVAFAGIGSDDMESVDARVAEAMQTPGVAGVAFEPGWGREARYFDDAAFDPLYEHCERAGVAVVLLAGGNAGPDISYSSPVPVDRVAARFPDLTIVIAHGGFPWVSETLGMAFRRPNVYVSPDMYGLTMPGWRDYFEAANGFLSERFLYASSYPFLPIVGALRRFRGLGFSPQTLERLIHGNAARLLGRDGR